MPFDLATPRNRKLLIGLSGTSGSGKTRSALELATGLVGKDGKICFIDTEHRANWYADKFKFYSNTISRPYTPEAYSKAAREAVEAGADVIIVDSMSHAWGGPGGLLQEHGELVEKRSGGDAAKAERISQLCWARLKPRWNFMFNEFLTLGVHVILCYRAKEVAENLRGKTRNKLRMKSGAMDIISEGGEIFDLTLSLLMDTNRPGYVLEALKLPDEIRNVANFSDRLSRHHGELLRAWADGEALQDDKEYEDLKTRANEAASNGFESLRTFWQGLTPQEQGRLQPDKDRLKRAAQNIDEMNTSLDDDGMTLTPDDQAVA
ncbi:MAG: AAA family ATPase [Pseudomonadota bacterium]